MVENRCFFEFSKVAMIQKQLPLRKKWGVARVNIRVTSGRLKTALMNLRDGPGAFTDTRSLFMVTFFTTFFWQLHKNVQNFFLKRR